MKYSMFYIYGATIHWIVEITITLIKLFSGEGMDSFDVMTYKQWKKELSKQ